MFDMSERKLTTEKQKEWDEIMEQIKEEIDALPPYTGEYFNNAAAMKRYNVIFNKYKNKLNKILEEKM